MILSWIVARTFGVIEGSEYLWLVLVCGLEASKSYGGVTSVVVHIHFA
jgi:hypothetical protein